MQSHCQAVFIDGDDILRLRTEHERISVRHLIDSPRLGDWHSRLDGEILARDNVQLIEAGIRNE